MTSIAAAPMEVPAPDSIFKPALLLMCGRILAFAATFFMPVVLARVFDRADFGTYKQLFLIYTVVYLIAQIGMASSLYYFLPLSSHEAGQFVANSVACLAASGLVCLAWLSMGGSWFSRWLSNPQLGAYTPWIGCYLVLMMISSVLEIVMIARGRYAWASLSYAAFDVARAAGFILPALLFHRLDWVLKGAVAVAAVRAAFTLLYLRYEFRERLTPDMVLLARQLSYALPFALAVLADIAQSNLHQYAVSHTFDPATFAIYAVGCLQIPFVDFVANPTSDVMMVKMREHLSQGRNRVLLEIWHEATRKLALLFFPLVGLLVAASREIILFLFTAKYSASVPVFAVWSTSILLASLQVDGVLRVYAQTRFLLAMNLVRLAIIAALIGRFLSYFGLLGPVLITLLVSLVGKGAALARMKALLQTDLAGLLPWRSIAVTLSVAALAGVVSVAVKSRVQLPLFATVILTATVYGMAYAAMLWRFNLINASEKSALTGWIRRAAIASARRLAWGV